MAGVNDILAYRIIRAPMQARTWDRPLVMRALYYRHRNARLLFVVRGFIIMINKG